jgi:hypothetical protein
LIFFHSLKKYFLNNTNVKKKKTCKTFCSVMIIINNYIFFNLSII